MEQQVKVTRSFYLSAREVSNEAFNQFVETTKGGAGLRRFSLETDSLPPVVARENDEEAFPVQGVTWYDCVRFCNWLSQKEGLNPCYERSGKREQVNDGLELVEVDIWNLVPRSNGYRLPTEAEWEYSCRAGTTTEFCCGDDLRYLDSYAVYRADETARCGAKLPNSWGLFDMHGNIAEWCQDYYAEYPRDPLVVDPLGPAVGSARIVRGGASMSVAIYVGSSERGVDPPAFGGFGHFGIRVAQNCTRE